MSHSLLNTCFLALLSGLMAFAEPVAGLVQSDIFRGGTDGYHTYRIPALVVTTNGTLLAFAEGRKSSGSDAGDIDLLLKRSTDGGKSWGEQILVWDDGDNTCGNPCPVVDQKTGAIFLLLTRNRGVDKESQIIARTSLETRTVWVAKSTDDGQSWSAPVEITSAVKKPEWGWYATGPGSGIQIRHGKHKGRLVIPCDHSYPDPNGTLRAAKAEYGSHAIYSDDHGQTWKLGGVIRPKVNECQVVELADGALLMDMRSYFGRNRRTHSWSRDGAITWTEPQDHPQLIEPVCQASILRYSWPGQGSPSRIVFSNPADEKRRRNLSVRLSYDEAKTWPIQKTINEGWSAYSSLAVLPGGAIGCLYERGENNPYEKISFARIPIEWLEAAAASSAASALP